MRGNLDLRGGGGGVKRALIVANTMPSCHFNLVKSNYHSRQGLCLLFRSVGLRASVLGTFDVGSMVCFFDARTGSKRLWSKV